MYMYIGVRRGGYQGDESPPPLVTQWCKNVVKCPQNSLECIKINVKIQIFLEDMLPGPSVMALVLQPLHFLSFLYHKHLLSGSLPYSGHPPFRKLLTPMMYDIKMYNRISMSVTINIGSMFNINMYSRLYVFVKLETNI